MTTFTVTKQAEIVLTESQKAISKTTLWRLNNPEKHAAQKLAYKEKQRLSDAKYYEKNKRRIIARQLNYDLSNHKKVQEYRADWRSKNKDKLKPYLKKWREDNKSLCQKYHRNRKARVLGNGGVSSENIGQKLFKLQKSKCACCKKSLIKNKFHIDHIVPLAKGGGSEDKNLQLLCIKCNLQKKSKCPIEFMQSRGYLL